MSYTNNAFIKRCLGCFKNLKEKITMKGKMAQGACPSQMEYANLFADARCIRQVQFPDELIYN